MGTSSSKQTHRHNHYHALPSTTSRRGAAGATPSTTHPSIMPTFFSFEQGSERAQNVRHYNTIESSPLLGRFKAVPRQNWSSIPPKPGIGRSRTAPGYLGGSSSNHNNSGRGLGVHGAGWRGSVHVGYGAISQEEEEEEEDEESEDEDVEGNARQTCGRRLRRVGRRMKNTWVDPKAAVVRKLVDVWWTRWGVLVLLPASLAVGWVAVPFPQYPLPYDDNDGDPKQPGEGGGGGSRKVPGHGAARVQVNFWWFLFVYYSFYSLTALIWITKVFNLYSLNWWPQSLGFPLTVSAIAILSLAAPIPIYLIPETKFLTVHNTAWISWTFVIMAMPVTIAFCILMTNERHLGLRHSLSETQRIFTSSWWAGDRDDTISRRERRQRAAILDPTAFDPSPDGGQIGFNEAGGGGGGNGRYGRAPPVPVRMRRRWLPASFVRFVWFCLALFIGLLAYVIGEAYAEIYLRTLPHNNLETIVYVYGWISTVHLLDGLTGWILGGNEGERVGSYPLSWIFKLYFMLTYQTYVRALYARLRDPAQFAVLQILSSTGLIIVTPILMSRPVHWFLCVIGANGQSYGSYQKICIRNVFIRFLAENASMLAFLGSVVVLHFGANQDVYPYFAFDGSEEMGNYTFNLTFYASSVTWACELAASFVVAGLIRVIYKVSVVQEGKLDFVVWPELLPTSVAVILHVLQNMLFSIIRLQFI
ncbi:hypothetical protein QBC43DRAFT_4630 [Cladorrhinum sp. PSN259]|nr:hypothetical protein QBC43DRAFT_4630 [Cladorrhinum sp. PSN259]